MMRLVFQRIPPRKIVQFYVESQAKPKQLAKDMWDEFGTETIACMLSGVHLLAVLWQSAWLVGGADKKILSSAIKELSKVEAMEICQDPEFIPSLPVSKIGSILQQPI